MMRNQSTSLGDQLRKREAEKMGGEWEEKRSYPFGTLKKSTDHRTQASMLYLRYAFARAAFDPDRWEVYFLCSLLNTGWVAVAHEDAVSTNTVLTHRKILDNLKRS